MFIHFCLYKYFEIYIFLIQQYFTNQERDRERRVDCLRYLFLCVWHYCARTLSSFETTMMMMMTRCCSESDTASHSKQLDTPLFMGSKRQVDTNAHTHTAYAFISIELFGSTFEVTQRWMRGEDADWKCTFDVAGYVTRCWLMSVSEMRQSAFSVWWNCGVVWIIIW